MKKENKNLLKAGGLLSLTIISIIVVTLTLGNIGNVTVEYKESKPVTLPWVGDADPGSGASGFLRIVIVNLNSKTFNSSWNGTGDLSGDSDVLCYTDANGTHICNDLSYTANFEIAIKVRFNVTHAYETGVQWRMDWVNGWANCTDPNGCLDETISALECDEELIAKGDTYMWIWYVADHSDSGGYYQDRGCNTTGLSFNFNAYY